MATKLGFFLLGFFLLCSKPTVWDGDDKKSVKKAVGFLSSKPTVWDGDLR